MLGTAAYMSPEQIRAKELDARSDLFSFGAVLYEMAAGSMPFEGSSSGEICGAILHQNPRPASHFNPQLPPQLEAIIDKALEKDRNLRYQSAAEMRADLQRLKRDTDSRRSAVALSAGSAEFSAVAGTDSLRREAAIFQTGRPKWKSWAFAGGGLGLLVIGSLIYRESRPLPLPKVSGYVPVTHDGHQKGLVGTDGSRIFFNEISRVGFCHRAGVQLRWRGHTRLSSRTNYVIACGFSRRGNPACSRRGRPDRIPWTALRSAGARRVTTQAGRSRWAGRCLVSRWTKDGLRRRTRLIPGKERWFPTP
jgi:hypothetical protein